jgi:serine/threonine protein kinase
LSRLSHIKPQEFGPYTLVRRLATGGMGELYLARRGGVAGFSKQVVVKRLRSDLANDREFVEMFLTEGRVAALLDHPNVVHIYDLGQIDGIYYMAMEYIPGQDLGTLLARNGGPPPLSIVLSILINLCEGVAFAHDATGLTGEPLGLVHRDINPQNVLISYSGGVAITDFGIAKVRLWQRETRAGVLKGKYGYLAPEQAHAGKVDRRTDVYAIGLLLFESSLGERAVPGISDTELIYASADGVVRRPSELDPAYPAELERIYLKAAARRPEDRYQTVRELQTDLVRFQVDQRLAITSSRLAGLMQRLFAGEWTEERKLMTPTDPHIVDPTAARGTPGGLHEAPTMLKPPAGLHESPTVPESLVDTIPPESESLVDTIPPESESLVDTIPPQPSPDDPTVTDLPSLPDDALEPGDSVPTLVRDRPDAGLAHAETLLLGNAAPPSATAATEQEVVLAGPQEAAELDRSRRFRWPIIITSALVTLVVAGGAAYYLLFTQGGMRQLDSVVAPDSRPVASPEAPPDASTGEALDAALDLDQGVIQGDRSSN